MARRYVRLRILTRAEDADLCVLSSKPGADCLLTQPPDGEGQKIDWAEGKIETGSYSWYAADKYQSAATRAITKQLADAAARDQLLGNRAIYEDSPDGTSWTAVHTGYVVDYQLHSAIEFAFTVADTDRREQKVQLFRTVTDRFDRVCCIIGGPVVADPPVAWSATPARSWGPVIDYGPARFTVIANPSGLVTPGNRITLSLISGVFPPLYLGQQSSFSIPLPLGLKISIAAEEIDRLARKYFVFDSTTYATDGSQRAQPWGSFPGLEVKLTRVSGGAVTRSFPIAQETTKAIEVIPGLGSDYPVGDYSALVANSNKRLIVAWDAATMGSAPTVGTQFDVLVYPRAIDADNPLHLRGHPIDLHTAANDQEGIPYSAATAASTKTAIGAGLFVELRIDAPMSYGDFTKKLKQACGYGVRYNAAGEQEFFPTLTDAAAVGTITPNDIVSDGSGGPKEVILKTATSSAISGVDYKLKVFRLWNAKIDDGDRPADGVVAQDQLIEGRRADDAVPSDRVLTYDLPGQILLAGGSVLFAKPFDQLLEWIRKAGDVIIDRRGWAAKEGALEVLDTVPGQVGDYLNSEAPHQVNAKVTQTPVAQRGGTRKLQIVGRTKRHGTALLLLEDAGNLAQDPPETPDDGTGGKDPNDGIPVPELSLAPSADDPLTIADATVDNASDITPLGGDVYLEYAVQEAEPTEAGTPYGPVPTSVGTNTLALPAIATGATIWARGQTRISATGQMSDWSDWVSITLGPDDDGTGGTLPPIDLVLTIDAAGVVSASATGIAAITKVYFAPGSPVGSSPSFADVLAGVADASAPFTAPSIATLTEGQTLIVGAVGEDALGNRTIEVTRPITRGVDTGAGSGTPGNISLTLIAGAPAVCRNVGAGLREYRALQRARKYWNTANVLKARLQPNVWAAASAGSELHWVYSLTGGPPFAESGVFVRADRVNFPEPGAFLALVAGAIGPNVLFTLATKNGDGSLTLKTSDVFVDTVSGEPPDSPTGDPPDVPTGGALGSLVHRTDAREVAATLADGASVTTAPDTGLEDGAAQDSAPTSFGQTSPTFVAAAPANAKPAIRYTAGSTKGLRYVEPDNGTFTRYYVLSNVSVTGSLGHLALGRPGGPRSWGIWVNPDGTVSCECHNSIVDNNTITSTAVITDGGVHRIRWVFDKLSGYHKLWIDGVLQGTHSASPQFFTDTAYVDVGYTRDGTSLGCDLHDELHYTGKHEDTGDSAVETALIATWGL